MELAIDRAWRTCRARVAKWRTPPGWSFPDWMEEMRGECASGAFCATLAYDPSHGVPLEAYLLMRAMGSALARYRREWRAGMRLRPETPAEPAAPHHDRDMHSELAALPEAERLLVHGLYWEGRTEAEMAVSLGISQQMVSRRKRAALARLAIRLAP